MKQPRKLKQKNLKGTKPRLRWYPLTSLPRAEISVVELGEFKPGHF